jgi:hypothetical protein
MFRRDSDCSAECTALFVACLWIKVKAKRCGEEPSRFVHVCETTITSLSRLARTSDTSLDVRSMQIKRNMGHKVGTIE